MTRTRSVNCFDLLKCFTKRTRSVNYFKFLGFFMKKTRSGTYLDFLIIFMKNSGSVNYVDFLRLPVLVVHVPLLLHFTRRVAIPLDVYFMAGTLDCHAVHLLKELRDVAFVLIKTTLPRRANRPEPKFDF